MPYDHKRYMREYRQQSSSRMRMLLNQLKEHGCCARCGFDDPRALQFHHLDPSTKRRNVPSLIGTSDGYVLAEIAKCEILCANCHAIEHFEQTEAEEAEESPQLSLLSKEM